MRILRSIVLPSSALMQVLDAEIASRSAIGPQVVRDQSLGSEGVFLQKLAHQFQSGVLVALGLDRLKPHSTWHLDEVYLKIDGRMVYLWRAVDAEGAIGGASTWRPV